MECQVVRPDFALPRGNAPIDVVQRLSNEILRKLSVSAENTVKEESENLCEEIFIDLTGKLETKAQQILQTDQPCAFFEILSSYYAAVRPYTLQKRQAFVFQNFLDGERVLEVCRGMWGQSYVAAIFALLLHKWLLGNADAGGVQRHKYLNVLLTGCRQLFWTDIHSNTFRFDTLFHFMHRSYTSDTQHPLKNTFLPLIGQFLTYYHTEVSQPTRLTSLSDCLQDLSSMVMELPFDHQSVKILGPWMRDDVGFTPDVLFVKITEMLKQLDGQELGLVRTLTALKGLKNCPLLSDLTTVTRVQFQAQLYSLTSQGGPRYPSRRVQRCAFGALDALYPAGARTRKVISQMFKIFHPLDWPRTTAGLIQRVWKRFLAFVLFIFSWIRFFTKPFFG